MTTAFAVWGTFCLISGIDLWRRARRLRIEAEEVLDKARELLDEDRKLHAIVHEWIQ